jgi:hypothetical protein
LRFAGLARCRAALDRSPAVLQGAFIIGIGQYTVAGATPEHRPHANEPDQETA